MNQYEIGLDKNPANYVPLTPLSFLERSAAVYPNQVSTVYEGLSFTWAPTYERCRRFASRSSCAVGVSWAPLCTPSARRSTARSAG